MNRYLLDNLLDRQMTVEQIEVLEELLVALGKVDSTPTEEAFKSESSFHNVFNICYEEDETNLIGRVEDAFPNLEGYIEQLNYDDYYTDHDSYESIEEEQEAKKQLLDKIENWKDTVNLFIENLCEMY